MKLIIEKIENERLRQKLSKEKLCRLSGLSKSNYYNYYNGSEPPYKAIEALFTGLGYKLSAIKELD